MMADPIGFAADMQRIENEIADIGGAESLSAPIDPGRVTRYLYLMYQRVSLAGDPLLMTAVEQAIDSAIPFLKHPGDLYLMKANLAFKLHRLADVRSAVGALPTVCSSPEGKLICADLLFQHGWLAKAQEHYLAALKVDRSWSALAHLAYFYGKTGDPASADRLYAEAEQELTAKEMRSFAWLEVQRGFLAFTQGAYSRAHSHYDCAAAAYSGYWLVDEYVAELLGAEGGYRRAVQILERILATARRPELAQAVGELYELAGETATAQRWHERALADYLQSTERGEVHYYHHLTDYYANVAKDGRQAIRWALADLRLRENFGTQSALAWAFHCNRQPGEACEWIDRAMGTGVVDAHVCWRAAKIYASAGNVIEARGYAEQAERLNPSIDKFHLHH
jgi:tetratricopeptide (TPR) repeat protein